MSWQTPSATSSDYPCSPARRSRSASPCGDASSPRSESSSTAHQADAPRIAHHPGDRDAGCDMEDALRPAPDASYTAQLSRTPISDADAERAAKMLGRPLRGTSAVAVRCGWGLPAVLRVSPQLDDGSPFPTLFWLTCPLASSAVARLEGQGHM